MRLENLKEFIKTTGKSKSTIYRFYNKNVDLKAEWKLRNGVRLFPKEHAKYFDSEIMFDENKLLRQENKSMKNLIDGLVDRDSLATTFWYLDWSYFVTVAYKAERNQQSCFRQMHALYDYLVKGYGKRTDIRLFFATEPFANRKGYHNHMVIYLSNEKLHETIMNEMQEFFSFDRVEHKPYDRYKAGVFYIAKEGLVNEDWDILFDDDKLRQKLNPLGFIA